MKREIHINLNLIIFGIVIFFQRMAVPYLNYFFIPYFIFILGYLFYRFFIRTDKIEIVKNFTKTFYLFLLTAAVFLLSVLFYGNYNSFIIRDIIHIGIILFFLFAIIMEIPDNDHFQHFIFLFALHVFITSGLIAVLGLMKMVLSLAGIGIPYEIPLYNSSLSSDYNFYSLSNILGLISGLFILSSKRVNKKSGILSQIIIFLLSVSIIFSTSRRGILVFVFLMITLIMMKFLANEKIHVYRKINFFIFLFAVFIGLFTFYFYTYNNNILQKFKRSEFNVTFVNNTLFQLARQYGSFFGYNYSTADEFIPIDMDSRYPSSKWGRRKHSEIYPLHGRNVEIVPQGAVGYMLDKRSEANTWSGNAYILTDISKLFSGHRALDGEFYASVYCYVTEDFNGSMVLLRSEGNVSGNRECVYDLNNRDCWQKLQIDFKSESGFPSVYLFVGKENSSDMTQLSGYVIFAYPEFEIRKHHNSFGTVKIEKSGVLHSAISLNVFKDLPSKEDTVSKINTFINLTPVTASRLDRWKFGINMYVKDYTLTEKFFGKGFSYLQAFGVQFNEAELDYPHNPLIDSLLYSGLTGFFLYFWFLIAGAFYYLKYRGMHIYFLVCYCIVIFFSLVSANTHFAIPIFAFLSLVPFISNYLQK